MGNTCSNGVSIVMLVFGGVIFQGVFYDLYLQDFSTDWLMVLVGKSQGEPCMLRLAQVP